MTAAAWKFILSVAAVFTVAGGALSTGLWLISMTDYPFLRVVSGGTLLFFVGGLLLAALAYAEQNT